MTPVSKLVGSVTAIAVVAVIALVWNQGALSQSNRLGTEAFKLLLQFFLIVVLGGAISLLHKEYHRERDARLQQRESWRTLFSDLVGVYNEAKRLRRLLRAQAVQGTPRTPQRSTPPSTTSSSRC